MAVHPWSVGTPVCCLVMSCLVHYASTPFLVAAARVPARAPSEERPACMSVASTPREPWSHGRRRGLGCLFCFLSFHALHAVKGDTSASQMPQECLVHDTPWCTRNRAFSTITQSFSFVTERQNFGGTDSTGVAISRNSIAQN